MNISNNRGGNFRRQEDQERAERIPRNSYFQKRRNLITRGSIVWGESCFLVGFLEWKAEYTLFFALLTNKGLGYRLINEIMYYLYRGYYCLIVYRIFGPIIIEEVYIGVGS
jgi:hypothetical protein